MNTTSTIYYLINRDPSFNTKFVRALVYENGGCVFRVSRDWKVEVFPVRENTTGINTDITISDNIFKRVGREEFFTMILQNWGDE